MTKTAPKPRSAAELAKRAIRKAKRQAAPPPEFSKPIQPVPRPPKKEPQQ